MPELVIYAVQKEAISRLTADDLEHAGLGPPPMPVLTEEVPAFLHLGASLLHAIPH